MTFVDDRIVGLEGEIVEASAISLTHGDEFEHIVAHAMSCTLKKEDVNVFGCDELRF